MACRCSLPKAGGERDLTGKVAIVTGASAGIGIDTAEELARRNARVIMACRNMAKSNPIAEEIIKATGNSEVVVMQLNLSSFESVKKFVSDFLSTETRLDILINNAGFAPQERTLTADGHEECFQVNHLSHFLLTLLLKDILVKSAPSRVVNVTSSGYKFVGKLEFDNLESEKSFGMMKTYSMSKLANIQFTLQLAKEWQGTGVTTYSVHPGFVSTSFTNDFPFIIKCLVCFWCWSACFAKNSKEGAQTSLYCALEEGIENHSGQYFAGCKMEPLRSQGSDEKTAAKLWEVSMEMVKDHLQ